MSINQTTQTNQTKAAPLNTRCKHMRFDMRGCTREHGHEGDHLNYTDEDVRWHDSEGLYIVNDKDKERLVSIYMGTESKPKRIPHYLLEAYKGWYEESEGHKFWNTKKSELSVRWYNHEGYINWCMNRIWNDLPEEHLRIYLEWNGIHGYTNQVLNLGTGKWFMA